MAWHGPDGRQLYYEDTGRGDTVLLMPGWAGNIVEFYELRQELASGFPRGRYLEIDGGHDLYRARHRVLVSTISGWLGDH